MVAHEIGMPSVRRHVAHAEAMSRIGTAIEILHEQIARAVEVGAYICQQLVEVVFRVG